MGVPPWLRKPPNMAYGKFLLHKMDSLGVPPFWETHGNPQIEVLPTSLTIYRTSNVTRTSKFSTFNHGMEPWPQQPELILLLISPLRLMSFINFPKNPHEELIILM
jgi:hypothetical protein